MFWQWPVLAIHAVTTSLGVGNPVAMFSPAEDQLKPTPDIRAAKSAPWVKEPVETILLLQPWAERSRRLSSCRAGRP
jgi:hypothetical protein